MNQHLSNIELFIQQSALTVEEKQKLLKEILNADKQWNILEFKLDRTEKVKRTTGVLLEETIEELEKKRKAVEAQNRELEIEAALERVRSRTSAMRSSEDLHAVINEVNDQLRLLNFQFDGTDFMTDYSDKGYNIWLANFPSPFYVPSIDHKLVRLLKEVIQRGDNFFTFTLTREEKNEYFKNIFENTIAKNTPEELKQYVYNAKGMATSCVVLKNIKLSVTNFASIPFTDIENEILKRFAYVFEQSYTRFLDLQKAEAQAREAEIELGLERVRARAMAMHGSDELKELVKTLFEELIRLDVKLATCLISTFDISTLDERSWMFHPVTREPYFIRVPYNEQPFYHEMLQAWKERNAAWNYCLGGETKVKWHDFLFIDTEFALLPQSVIDEMRRPDKVFFTASYYSYGAIQVASLEPFPAQSIDIIQRFSKVFDLSYTRFLDLQKAEAQARKAQVELGLERVRARAMAMHKSNELLEAGALLYSELSKLGVEKLTSGYMLIDEDGKRGWNYGVNPANGQIISQPVGVLLNGTKEIRSIIESWKKQEPIHVLQLDPQETIIHQSYMADNAINFPISKTQLLSITPERLVIHTFNFKHGYLIIVGGILLSEEQQQMVARFARVFEMTYRRFLDLQKAEAQARESDIELSLERVRAKTMAMQKPSEFVDVVNVIGEQFVSLGFDIEWVNFGANGFAITEGIDIWNFAVIPGGSPIAGRMFIPYFDHPVFAISAKSINEYLSGGKDFFVMMLDKQMKDTWLDHMYALTIFKDVPHELRKIQYDKPGYTSSNIALKETWLSIGKFDIKPFSDEQHAIQRRLANAFGQAYTRFHDLQKAEAQAREAQVEAALERVRSRSIGMQKSEELKEVIQIVYQQFVHLNINLDHAGFVVDYKPKNNWHFWIADKQEIPSKITHPYFDSVWANQFDEAKEKGINIFATYLNFEEKNKFYEDLLAFVPGLSVESKNFYMDCPALAVSTVLAENVSLYIENFSGIPYTIEENAVLMRFGKVFQQTYTRFLDLQKAEAQARESEIELALERLRARTMAMKHSDELADASFLLDSQIRGLGIKTRGCAFNIYGEKDSTEWFSSEMGTMPAYKTPRENIFLTYYEAGKTGIPIYINSFSGDDCAAHYDYLCTLPVMGDELKEFKKSGGSFPTQQRDHVTYFKYGYLLFITLEPVPESHDIFIRFAKVFEQTYTRFLDLQKAEAQAREAQIEAALERVRSRTLAMQKSDELAETSAVLFKQLIALGIEPHRLYISIMKDAAGESEFWITDEDGSRISMAYTANLNANPSFKKMYDGWKQQTRLPDGQEKSLIIDMQGKELEAYFQHLTSLGVTFKDGLKQTRRIQHIAYFNKGFIGLAAPDDQPEETIHLLERFAAVFNLTFTRFSDLKIAEAHALQAEQDLIEIKAARKKAEDALTELQATQKQLIQSEKMASLGELTAGIAHEIQNPLNFVNNFSEVSNEMIEEMKEELATGNLQLVTEIADDIKQNLEKINHHGKRADAIVKGMLQHSRTSSGQKEPTDINVLCDEYLRLSYHGLRAKDKNFNADFKTDFDESIGKINIVPQDIGRVLLNLINNAFYAVSNPPSTKGEQYKPLVIVTTRKIKPENTNAAKNTPLGDGGIEIRVEDNGHGIPQNIIDKIFQPFFTTKPTGSGTGLGLSLSYDIIKAHGGEIKVETKESEGSQFIIQLPV